MKVTLYDAPLKSEIKYGMYVFLADTEKRPKIRDLLELCMRYSYQPTGAKVGDITIKKIRPFGEPAPLYRWVDD